LGEVARSKSLSWSSREKKGRAWPKGRENVGKTKMTEGKRKRQMNKEGGIQRCGKGRKKFFRKILQKKSGGKSKPKKEREGHAERSGGGRMRNGGSCTSWFPWG